MAQRPQDDTIWLSWPRLLGFNNNYTKTNYVRFTEIKSPFAPRRIMCDYTPKSCIFNVNDYMHQIKLLNHFMAGNIITALVINSGIHCYHHILWQQRFSSRKTESSIIILPGHKLILQIRRDYECLGLVFDCNSFGCLFIM